MEKEQKTAKEPYNGWIVSNSFLKRAFAITGHVFVASLIINIVLFPIMMMISLSIAKNMTENLQMQTGDLQGQIMEDVITESTKTMSPEDAAQFRKIVESQLQQ